MVKESCLHHSLNREIFLYVLNANILVSKLKHFRLNTLTKHDQTIVKRVPSCHNVV